MNARIRLVALWACAVAANAFPAFADGQNKASTAQILFSPKGGCTQKIIDELNGAKKSIRVQAYSFTSAPIAKAILDANHRGLDVEVILDKSQATQQYSEADFFRNQGVDVLIDPQHAIAHNKVIIIDDVTVITGSFNFTKAAEESNAENLIVFKDDRDVARQYSANYQKHREHSRAYEGRIANQPDAARAPPVAPQTASPPASAHEKAEQGATIDPTVFVTRSGAKYHSAGCSYLRSSAIPMPLSQAARRYGPCSRCRPPVP